MPTSASTREVFLGHQLKIRQKQIESESVSWRKNISLEKRTTTRFGEYVNGTYIPIVLPLLASTTRACYEQRYLMPQFHEMPLRDLTTLTLQKYFSSLGATQLGGDTVQKIKEVLSSVLGSAVLYDLLTKNPLLAVVIPRNKVVNRKKKKPTISPEEFERLVELVDEPYSTMIATAVFTGLRVSELVGLKWEDVHDASLTVDERYCRGLERNQNRRQLQHYWGSLSVIARLRRLRTLEVEINWGGKGARKRFKLVRADGPQDLVFQSLRNGAPMRDGNILRRHLRPAALKLGIDPKKATWRSLRTSCATWMIEAGANPKDVQGLMRHSRISTMMDIYAQHVPDSQRRAVARMMDMVESRRTQAATVN